MQLIAKINEYMEFFTLQGIIFVVDSADKSRFGEAMSELHAIIQEDGMRKVKLLFILSASDIFR